jgi:acyl-CoA dehydrogenase
MDFEIDEELEMLRSTAQKLVRDKLIPLENKLLTHGGAEEVNIDETVDGFVEEMGVWGMNVPEEFEGVGFPVLGGALVAYELGRTFIPVPIGDVSPLLFECDGELKENYLDPVVEREKTMAVAFREAAAGSETTARAKDGGFEITGAKRGGPRAEGADFFLVFARTKPHGPLKEGCTCFIVDKDAPCLTLEKGGKDPVVRLDKVSVPEGRVLGKTDKAFDLGRRWFPAERVRKAAEQLGTADRLVEISADYARDWQTFGRSLAERRAVRQALADSAAEIYAAKNMIFHAAWLIDEEKPAQKESMMVKLFVGELLKRVVARSVEIHGGPLPHFDLWLKTPASRAEHIDLMRAGLTRELTRTD